MFFSRDELAELAALAEEHDLLIISDEIHADLVYEPAHHVPIASLGPEVAARTLTLTSATKAFNLAGVRCAVAHIGPPALRERWDAQPDHLFGIVSRLGVEATRSAWQDGDDWLASVVAVLDRNRRLLGDLLAARLPAVDYVLPQATYLAWLDFRPSASPTVPRRCCATAASCSTPAPTSVPTVKGSRCNFATSAAVLEAIVDRMAAAVSPARVIE